MFLILLKRKVLPEKYRTIALAYTHFGVDRESVRVRWLKELC